MIEQNVQVVRCDEQRIWVRMGSQTGCSACDNGQGCGAGVFAKLLKRSPTVVELPRQDVDVEPGQMVTLAFPEQVYLKMVLAYYGWPLLAALTGGACAYSLGTWLQFEAAMLDVATLIGGLLVGGMAVRAVQKYKGSEVLLNSMQMAVYFPAATPHMCDRVMNEPEQD